MDVSAVVRGIDGFGGFVSGPPLGNLAPVREAEKDAEEPAAFRLSQCQSGGNDHRLRRAAGAAGRGRGAARQGLNVKKVVGADLPAMAWIGCPRRAILLRGVLRGWAMILPAAYHGGRPFGGSAPRPSEYQGSHWTRQRAPTDYRPPVTAGAVIAYQHGGGAGFGIHPCLPRPASRERRTCSMRDREAVNRARDKIRGCVVTGHGWRKYEALGGGPWEGHKTRWRARDALDGTETA